MEGTSLYLNNNLIFQFSSLDSYSFQISEIVTFYDTVMIVVVGVVSLVGFVFTSLFTKNSVISTMNSSEVLEVLWTVIPCVILTGLAAPSLLVLYLCEESSFPYFTLKVVGHQWYWSYEYSGGLNEKSFDSYLIPTQDVGDKGLRLLEVDKRAVLPVWKDSRILVTSSDVIHSWAVPPLGVNVDAIPGRLNQLLVYPIRIGIVYGQCSEMCGTNHSFIPICLELVSESCFLKFLTT